MDEGHDIIPPRPSVWKAFTSFRCCNPSRDSDGPFEPSTKKRFGAKVKSRSNRTEAGRCPSSPKSVMFEEPVVTKEAVVFDESNAAFGENNKEQMEAANTATRSRPTKPRNLDFPNSILYAHDLAELEEDQESTVTHENIALLVWRVVVAIFLTTVMGKKGTMAQKRLTDA